MPLINRSSMSIYWRIFTPDDRTRAFGIAPAYEGTIAAWRSGRNRLQRFPLSA
jgi:hypothetical protein